MPTYDSYTATSGRVYKYLNRLQAMSFANVSKAIIDGVDDVVGTLLTAIATKAPSASPALTGEPTVPTAAVDTSTDQIASTAFVIGQAATTAPLVDGAASAGTSKRFARQDHVHPTDTSRAPASGITQSAITNLVSDLAAKAPLASPALTGTPTVPTAVAGTNSTQIASTAFVQAAVGLVPVVPASIANTGGSASVSNGLVTFTGVTSLSLNGVFTSGYRFYRVELNASSAATANAYLVYRASGVDKTDAAYNVSQNYGTGSNAYTGATNALTAIFDTALALTTFDIANPAQASATSAVGLSMRAIAPLALMFGHTYLTAVAVDGFTITASSAFTGTVRVYGYN